MSNFLSTVKYALLAALFLTTAWNCRKDVDEFRPYVYAPSVTSINQLLVQASTPSNVHTFILKGLSQDTILTTPGGVRVGLTDPDDLFANANGQPVAASSCQNLQIEITEVLGKSELLGRGIHTATYPEGQLLESGGMVFIRATCDGSPLQMLPNRDLKVQLPASVLKNDMQAFRGQVQNATDFQGWQATGDPAYLAEWLHDNAVVKGYEIYPAQLGWVGAGRLLTEPSSRFCVKLPTAMTAATAQVFLVFKGLTVLAEPVYTADTQTFCFEQAPEGYPIQVVVVSKLGDQYWLGNKETEIGTHTSLQVEPQKTTEAALVEFLKHL